MLKNTLNLQVAAQRAFRLWGFEVRRHRFTSAAHELIFPLSTYSPWNLDQRFLDAFEKIKKNTLIEKYRCFGLWQLGEQTQKIEGIVVEIGTWRGGSAALLGIQSAARTGGDSRVFACDTFRGLVKAGPEDGGLRDGDVAVDRADTERFLRRELGLTNVVLLEGVFPDETGARLPDAPVRLCHIDVDTYHSARDTLDFIWPRLSVGGAVVFDDYGSHICPGIQQLVEEQRAKPDRLLVYNLNGHAILFKLGTT
jgi:O-methyltransferase